MKAKGMQYGLTAVLLSMLSGGAAYSQTATTGTINFTGSITDVPCEIDTAATSSNVPLCLSSSIIGGFGLVNGAV
ncbi:fimbrial protein, partial [Burkholderia pseudomallei]